MTNNEIAKIFSEIADILELQNANSFRIRAYRQAAKAVSFYSEPMNQVYEKGGREALLDIPALGEALADKVIELLETGKLYFYEKLLKSVPSGELAIGEIPGVGPRTAQKLYELLKPAGIPDLKKKLLAIKPNAKGERELDGFHEKTIVKVLSGIEFLSHQTGRMVLSEAWPIAQFFIDRLKKLPAVKQIDPVGSLRRMQETIGDIDIVAAVETQDTKHDTQNTIHKTRGAKEVIDSFVSHDSVDRIVSAGDTKATIVVKNGPNVDLEILPQKEYGSLLQHFTGSKEHNIVFRALVEDLGLSFSEHGFKVIKASHPWAKKAMKFAKKRGRWDEERKLILCPKEHDVYETVGLQWIPPELRENNGELASARGDSLPDLIESQDIRGDIHVHSNRSGDAREEPAAIVERALALGYSYVGITEHTKGLGVAGKLTDKELLTHADELRKLNQKYPKIKILAGCELNIMADGRLDVSDKILGQLDVVIASVHSSFNQNREVMTRRILGAIENPNVDIIAHPMTRILGYRDGVDADWEEIFKAAAKTRTAFEINAHPERLDFDSVMVRRAKECGCQFVISTDAHQLAHLDNMLYGVAMARRGWLTKEDVLNTSTAELFKKWLER